VYLGSNLRGSASEKSGFARDFSVQTSDQGLRRKKVTKRPFLGEEEEEEEEEEKEEEKGLSY